MTPSKLFNQFFLIPNCLLLPFFSPVLAFFGWLDCLVVEDCLFLGTYGSYRETPFSVAAAVIHVVCAWVG